MAPSYSRLRRLLPGVVLTVAAVLIVAGAAKAGGVSAETGLMRFQVRLDPRARHLPRPMLMTLGGPVYCMQLERLARDLGASLLCTDYGPNRDEGTGERSGRREDWGDPRYLAEVARLPAQLRQEGVKISRLVLVGVSYSGFADAELVATHPELGASALVVIDSYLDLPSRYAALPLRHETRTEIEQELGGTLQEEPQAYAARSPSSHLAGIADAMRNGMKLAVVWSVARSEEHEFRGATCSLRADALWLGQLAGLLDRPVVGYVTQMRHAHALWDRGRELLGLVGVGSVGVRFPARRVQFDPGQLPPAGSYCSEP